MEAGRVTAELEPRADQVSAARRWVARSCAGMDSERVHVAKLLVSELVTRALQRHPSTLRLVARKGPQGLRVDVREEGPQAAPEPGPGRHRQPPSMAILARLSSTWGEKLAARRRTVWFTLEDESKGSEQGSSAAAGR